MTNHEISHNVARRQFATTVDGQRCELDYTLDDKVMAITHTGVPDQVSGRGIAAELIRFGLEWARASGWRVVPACSYAVAYMSKHPEFDDLRYARPGSKQKSGEAPT